MLIFTKSTEEEEWGAGALQACVMTALLCFSVITPRFWRRVKADYRTFPSCAWILVVSCFCFFFLQIFLFFFLILFFSSHITPTLAVLHPSLVASLLHSRWLPEIIGGQILQGESEQTYIQQGHNVCDSFLLTFSPDFPKTPTSGPPAYRGYREGIFLNMKRVSVKFRCQWMQQEAQHFYLFLSYHISNYFVQLSELLIATFAHLPLVFSPSVFAFTCTDTDFYYYYYSFLALLPCSKSCTFFPHLIICDHPTIKAAATLLPWQQVVDAAVACREQGKHSRRARQRMCSRTTVALCQAGNTCSFA